MAGNTNLTDRIPSRIAATTKEIFTENDFPDPSGGVITITDSTVFVIAQDVTIPSRFVIDPGVLVEFDGAGLGKVITYSGAGPMFTTDGATLVSLNRVNIDLVGDDCVLFDIQNTVLLVSVTSIDFQGANCSIGSVSGAGQVFAWTLSQALGFSEGLTVDDIGQLRMDVVTLVTDFSGSTPLVSIGANVGRVNIDRSTFVAGASEELLFFDPSFSGVALIDRLVNPLGSVFFGAGSLDEEDVPIDVIQCPTQKDSYVLGSLLLNLNPTATPNPGNLVWGDFNMDGGAGLGAHNERWALLDTDTGEMEYSGAHPITAVITAILIVVVPAQTYEFRLVKNGVALPEMAGANGAGGPMTGREVNFLAPVDLITGDTIRLQVRSVTGSMDMTLVNLSLVIQAASPSA